MNQPTTENVLIVLADIGSDLANLANPNSYPHEYRDRAKAFEHKVKAARIAYAAIRDGGDAATVLRELLLVVITGIECNYIARLLDFVETGVEHPAITSAIERAKKE